MPLSRRYSPEWSPGDAATIGMDFSSILPPGIGIEEAALESDGPTPRLEIWYNFAAPQPAVADWQVDPTLAAQQGWWWQLGNDAQSAQWLQTVSASTFVLALGTAVVGRAVYAFVRGGNPGVDYQFRWTITDTLGNRFTRTGLLLVGLTS